VHTAAEFQEYDSCFVEEEVLTASRNLVVCRRRGMEIAVFQTLTGVVVGVRMFSYFSNSTATIYRVVQKSGTFFKYVSIHTCNAI